MKKCKMCARVLPLTEFSRKNADRETWNSYCRACQREYSRGHYARNQEKHNTRRYINQRRYVARNRQLMVEYLRDKPCVDCGLVDFVVMEFDHVKGTKSDDVSRMLQNGTRWQRILEEIAKCDIRCSNCHRRKTYRQLKSFRTDFGV